MIRWPESMIFYNNFEISHRSVWSPPSTGYEEFFDYIDHLGGIYLHRWGDAPIHTLGVSMWVPDERTHAFTDIAYKHKRMIDTQGQGLPPPSQGLFSLDHPIAKILPGIHDDSEDEYDSIGDEDGSLFASTQFR